MSEDELDAAFDARDWFWQEFRWLVRAALDRVPESAETDLRYMLQDSTSCWHPGIPERGEKKT